MFRNHLIIKSMSILLPIISSFLHVPMSPTDVCDIFQIPPVLWHWHHNDEATSSLENFIYVLVLVHAHQYSILIFNKGKRCSLCRQCNLELQRIKVAKFACHKVMKPYTCTSSTTELEMVIYPSKYMWLARQYQACLDVLVIQQQQWNNFPCCKENDAAEKHDEIFIHSLFMLV